MNEQPMDNLSAPTPNATQPMKKSAIISLVLAILVLAGGGGFYGGMQYEKKKLQDNPTELFTGTQSGDANGSVRQFGGPGGSNTNRSIPNGFAGRGVSGTIESISGTTMTVKSQDGSSKIVILPSSAAITKSTSGTTADLTTGSTVMVTGTTNDDGSVTATNIQLNPTVGVGAPPTDMPSTDTSSST